MNEQWKDISGYEGVIKVSNYGRVKRGRKIMQGYSHRGYIRVTLRFVKDVQIRKLVHRLVAEAWIENPNDYSEVNHINGVKHDNRVENLEWCTRTMNMQHAVKTGLVTNIRRGIDINTNKLTEAEVIAIRATYKKGVFGYKRLAEKFGVDQSNIQNIILNKTWKHLKQAI